jgi:hypothetical protein
MGYWIAKTIPTNHAKVREEVPLDVGTVLREVALSVTRCSLLAEGTDSSLHQQSELVVSASLLGIRKWIWT